MGLWDSGKKFLFGSPEVRGINPEAQANYSNLQSAAQKGKGGAFGQSADYYGGLMDENSQDYQNFANPALRQYSQDIVPGIAEQFAGMGAGGLSSSAFQNAQVQGATDLSERLGALRAQLRQQGAQGLQNLGNQSLQNYDQTLQQGTSGFIPTIANAAGSAAGSYFGGKFGMTNPYGNQGSPAASPQIKSGSFSRPTGYGG